MDKAISELKRSIEEDSTKETRTVYNAVRNMYYADTESIETDISLEDHLLITLTGAFLDTSYTNSDVLLYVSETFGDTAFWEDIPQNHDFIPYKIDNIDSSGTYLTKRTGDLALFNTGFLFDYHAKKKSPIDHTYFKHVGKEAYSKAAERINTHSEETLENGLLQLSEDFDEVTKTLRYAVRTNSMFSL